MAKKAELKSDPMNERQMGNPLVDGNSLDTILALIRQLEFTILGLKELRGYVGSSLGEQMLELLIEEGETRVAEIKRKLIQ